MIKRVILLVIDGWGAGALPDAADYGDAGCHTLSHLAEAAGGLNLPSLESLGLGHVAEIKGLRTMAQPIGSFGRLGFRSRACDSLAGHWELAGCVADGGAVPKEGSLSSDLLREVEQVFGRKPLDGGRCSAGAVLKEFGRQHVSTGAPIVWMESPGSCHVAAHEGAIEREVLYQFCREARKRLKDKWAIRRVVAHPIEGTGDGVRWRAGRRDFCVEPPTQTMLDVLNRAGQILIGVGKIGDLFSGKGLTRSVALHGWRAIFDEVMGMFSKVPRGLIYAGLDVLAGKPEDSAASLGEFDRKLSGLLEALRPGDLCVMTGDHGRDTVVKDGTPTREYVPLIVTGPRLAQGVNLGTRTSPVDLGQTIVEALQGEPLPIGESFLDALQAG
jgi:phosphopentomutase